MRVLSPRLCQLTLVQNLAHADIFSAKVIVFHFRCNARAFFLVSTYMWYFIATPSKFSCATFQTFNYISFCVYVFRS
jgi:hypothetical protein